MSGQTPRSAKPADFGDGHLVQPAKRATVPEIIGALCQPVEERLRGLLAGRREIPDKLRRAMLYPLDAGGKRVRPAICLAAAQICGEFRGQTRNSAHLASQSPKPAAFSLQPGLLDVAAAVEMVHTYSLIHDDLPAMDDDALRRGKPTVHRVFGEALAILAGDALLTLAFELLANAALAARTRVRLAAELAAAAGAEGMVAGQVLDLEGEGVANPTAEAVRAIHARKTARLIRASARMGVIAAGGPEEALAALSEWGEKAGLAFQVADDVLDAVASPQALGKSVGKDQRAGKSTAVAALGLEGARAEARRLAEQAEAALEHLAGADFFRLLCRYFIERAC